MGDWDNGTYNHLVGQSYGTFLLVSRMNHQTTEDDVASFFRNFHLQGNGVTIIHDVIIPNKAIFIKRIFSHIDLI